MPLPKAVHAARVDQTRADLRTMTLFLRQAYVAAGMTQEQAAEALTRDLQSLYEEFGPKYLDLSQPIKTLLSPKLTLERIIGLMQKDKDRSVQAYLRHLLDLKALFGW